MNERESAAFVRAHLPLSVPRIVTPAYQQEVILWFLDQPRGLLTHYTREGSKDCKLAECPSKWHDLGTTYKAYAPVLQWIHADQCWRYMVAELTANVANQMVGQDMRGQVWSIERTGRSRRKTVVSGKRLQTAPPESLPLPFDIIPTLKSAYSTSTLPSLGSANPIIPATPLPAIELPAPPSQPAPAKEAPMTAEEMQALREERAKAKARLNGNGKH